MENKIDVIFENENIIVVNKQPYIYVYKEDENIKKNTIIDYLKNSCAIKNVLPVTSLDFEASGIVVFAKNKKSYDFIADQFKKETVKRTYHIIVNGVMENNEGEINKKLIVTQQTTSVNDKGIKSVTKYVVKEQFKSFAFVEVFPVTVRKNQIRAHFWAAGNSLAIDNIYSSGEPLLLSSLKKRYKGINKEKPLLKRLPLHLSEIEFVLPETEERKVFTVDLAQDMKLTLKQLGKYNKRGS